MKLVLLQVTEYRRVSAGNRRVQLDSMMEFTAVAGLRCSRVIFPVSFSWHPVGIRWPSLDARASVFPVPLLPGCLAMASVLSTEQQSEK